MNWWNELSTFWQTSIVTIVTASLTAILTSIGALFLQNSQNKKEDKRQEEYFYRQLKLQKDYFADQFTLEKLERLTQLKDVLELYQIILDIAIYDDKASDKSVAIREWEEKVCKYALDIRIQGNPLILNINFFKLIYDKSSHYNSSIISDITDVILATNRFIDDIYSEENNLYILNVTGESRKTFVQNKHVKECAEETKFAYSSVTDYINDLLKSILPI